MEVGVVPITWSIGLPKYRKSPLFAEIIGQAEVEEEMPPLPSTETVDVGTKLQKASVGDRQGILVGYLQETIAKILGIKSSTLDEQNSLTSLGFDSLMAIELRNMLKTELNIDIPVSEFMAGKSILEIASYLQEKLSSSAINTEIEKISETTMEQLTEQELLDNLEQLSDTEVVNLLSTMLAETEESVDE